MMKHIDILKQVTSTIRKKETLFFLPQAELIAMECIEKCKQADTQSVRRGYWEEVTDYGGWGDTHYRCSVCGEEWYLEDGKPKDNNMNFCPRCGAKMDAEPDEPWQSE